ncbi:MAG: iron-containing alcohol dehydrogenase family protein [Candidatus Cloacimonadota bacterium]|nr:iron-containing alcohol dehydrogenase family protein [Candidatus Cloacimonadota bacterium]
MIRYYMPVEFYFGKNALVENGGKLKQWGQKAIVITGRSSAKVSGALDDLTTVFEQNGQEYTIFDKIKENPYLTTVKEGAKKLQDYEADFVIGIGGGSPIDAAKAISALAYNNLQGEEIYQTKKYINGAYPIMAIPTTSGTGTEVTPYSVITNKENGIKAGFGSSHIFPKISFIDPKYTLSLPYKVTKDTAIDALSHLLEGIYSRRRNKVNFPIIKRGIEIIKDNLAICLNNPKNLECREKLMLASTYGGMVISQTSTTIQHSIGYPLTSSYGVTHGLANGLVMKHIMEKFYPYLQEELDDLFAYLEMSKEDFYEWIDSLNLNVGVKIEDWFIEEKVEEVLNSRNMALNPTEVTAEDIKEIYKKIQ